MFGTRLHRQRNDRPRIFDAQLRRVATVTVLGSMMAIIDSTIVYVALSTLVRSFHSTLATIQWVSTAYLLSLATVSPLTQWVVDRFGAKRAFTAALSVFLVGSTMCGLSWSLISLICFRVVQGLGGGMIMPVGQTILARESGPERLGRVMSIVGVPQMLAPLLGPVLGGLILSNFSWRLIFFINLPIGLVALALTARHLPGDDNGVAWRIDLLGLCLLSPGMALVTYGIATFGNNGRFTTTVILALTIGAVLVAAFVRHALRIERPLLNIRLWRNRAVAGACSVAFLFAGGANAATFVVQLYLQIARGISPLRSGLLVAPAALGAMACLPVAGWLTDRFGPRRVVPFGLIITAATVIPLTQATPHTSNILLSVLWFLRGAGSGATFVPAAAAAYMTLARADVPAAATLNYISSQVGSTFGVALAAALAQRRVLHIVSGGIPGLARLSTAEFSAIMPALTRAICGCFWVTVAFVLLGLIPVRLLPDRRPRAVLEEVETLAPWGEAGV